MLLVNGWRYIVTLGKTARLNITDTGFTTALTGWTNILLSSFGSSIPLVDATGASTGWSCIGSEGSGGFFESIAPHTWGNTKFPDEIINTLVAAPSPSNWVFTISGLDAAKTYTITTMQADNGPGDGPQTVTVVGSGTTTKTTSVEPNNLALELIFPSIPPNISGVIVITCVGAGPGASGAMLSGAIITEN